MIWSVFCHLLCFIFLVLFESFTAFVILLPRESKPGFSVCKRSNEHWEVSWVSWIVNWLSWVAATSSWTSLWTATTGPASLGKRPFLQRTADCQERCWCGCIGIENRWQLNFLEFFVSWVSCISDDILINEHKRTSHETERWSHVVILLWSCHRQGFEASRTVSWAAEQLSTNLLNWRSDAQFRSFLLSKPSSPALKWLRSNFVLFVHFVLFRTIPICPPFRRCLIAWDGPIFVQQSHCLTTEWSIAWEKNHAYRQSRGIDGRISKWTFRNVIRWRYFQRKTWSCLTCNCPRDFWLSCCELARPWKRNQKGVPQKEIQQTATREVTWQAKKRDAKKKVGLQIRKKRCFDNQRDGKCSLWKQKERPVCSTKKDGL